jgi:tetratricopeptide (TPR) repeat protein
MRALSPAYAQIKQLRSSGQCDAAIAMLRAHPPAGDNDAFEAVVCLFVCGDLESALNVCSTHNWREPWAVGIAGALAESLRGTDVSRALELARQAVHAEGAPVDAAAIYLLLLRQSGLVEEARAYIGRRLQEVSGTETFLLTIMAEIAVSASAWGEAYRHACKVLAADPDDYRALIVMSVATLETGNVHESLGHAMRAAILRRGSVPAVVQLMRCRNKLGNFYGALAAADTLNADTQANADIHVELGVAYEGLEDVARAIEQYRAAVELDPQAAGAVRGLVTIYTCTGRAEELEVLKQKYAEEIEGDFICQGWLGLAAVNRGDVEAAANIFRKTLAYSDDSAEPLRELPWPVPEPRVRHDCEQLRLLASRGKLSKGGRDALLLLEGYCAQQSSADAAFAPSGAAGEALRKALTTTFHVRDVPFSGGALGRNDYKAIEERYLAERLVVIDDFLSAEALASLRGFCEEATVWKLNYERGYLGALLPQGFSPRVLLMLAHELKEAMPRVIGDQPLTQAWAYKYDQRMQGINMHADFADVNVNFWITPDAACEDPTTGGMVVYDLPVPKSWTFYEYNNESEKLEIYLRLHGAKAQRVPYRANRCVLFDSRLIHITDEMHFKPGYENRRINVTLLYGRGRSIG